MPTILSPFAEELALNYMKRADSREVDRTTAEGELQGWVDMEELTTDERTRILHVFDPRP